MSMYELPQAVVIDGKEFPIRTDFRIVLDALAALNDPELDDEAKYYAVRDIMFPAWDDIPTEYRDEAISKAAEFIDYIHRGEGKSFPRLVDWEQDADMIVSAINSVAHMEIRALPYLHWWTFLSYFMNIRESVYSTVLHIRVKKAKHKKLEKWEEEFYRANRNIVDIKAKETDEERAAREELEKWL